MFWEERENFYELVLLVFMVSFECRWLEYYDFIVVVLLWLVVIVEFR